MQRYAIAAAIGAAAFFGLLAVTATPAAYGQPQFELSDQVQPGAIEHVGPSGDLRTAQYVAPTGTEVAVVRPDQVNAVAETLPSLIAAAIVAILARFAGPFAWVLKVSRADQMIERYTKGVIDDWLDHNPDWRTKGITLDVKNAWAAQIATYVINYAPGWLIQFLGGKEAILQKVRNRLPDVIKEAFPALFDAHYTPAPRAP